MSQEIQRATPSGAVAKSKRGVKEWIDSPEFKAQVQKALPKHCTPDRFLRISLTAMLRTPKLAECTIESVAQCLLTCSQFGLEPDGRRAHLIPFEDRKKGTVVCTLILDYKGLVELAMRSGLVSHLHADVVRSGDVFQYNLGEITSHIPWFLRRDDEKPAESGEDVAVYAYARMKDGSSAVAVLSIEEVLSIRDNSQGWKAFKAGYTKSCPWDPANWVSEQEMKKKTALRRLTKMLPLSPEFRDAVEADDDESTTTQKAVVSVAAPIFSTRTATQALPAPAAEPEPIAAEPVDDDQIPGAEVPAAEPVRPATPPKAATAVQTPQPAPAAPTGGKTPQETLAEIVIGAGYTWDQWFPWAVENGHASTTATGFDEIYTKRANTLVANAAAMLSQFRASLAKEGGLL